MACPAVLIVLFAHGLVAAADLNATAYLQATWIPNSYESTSEQSLYNLMTSLKEEGVRTVYVDVWNQGSVFFNSLTMLNTVGAAGQGDDHLMWALTAGRALGIEVYAWFEYGLISSYSSINNAFAVYAEQQGWHLGQSSGFFWLDPVNTDALAFLADIMSDALAQYSPYGLKGVQLDDHFSTPAELGRSVSDMNAAMKFIRQNVNGVLSLSPSTLSFSLSSYNVDWNLWGSNNWYDEVIPQVYRTTYESYKSEVDYTLQIVSSQTKEKWVAVGVRVDGSGGVTPWEEVNNMLWYSNTKYMGNVVWYSKGLVETYSTQFQNVWGG